MTNQMTENTAGNQRAFLECGPSISKQFWYLQSILWLLAGMLAFIFSFMASDDSWWLHGAWCLIGTAIASPLFLAVYKAGVASVFSDHKIMLVASFWLYFVFGASLLAFGSEESRSTALAYYSIEAPDALSVFGMNCIGLGMALASGTWLSGTWFLGGAAKCAKYAARIPVHAVLLGFYVLGLLGYFSTVARDLGLQLIVVPGSISQFSMLLLFCVFLGAAFNGFLSRAINFLSLMTLLLMMLSGLLMFNKTALYLPVLAYFAGLSVRKASSRYLLYGVSVVVFSITFLGGLVNYGRAFALENGATFGERIELVNEYLGGSRLPKSQQYSAWSRLSYTVPQVAALDLYDQGNGGEGHKLIPWLFVPRLLAPNKPIITQSGSDFNYKIVGSYLSSTGMGVFVSGYYNMGWFGLVFASIFCGLFLSQSSALCAIVIREKAILVLPLGLLGLFAAFRIDGEIIGDFMGSYVFFLYPLLTLGMMFGMKSSRGGRFN